MKKYTTDFSEEDLKRALHANDQEAASLIDSPEKWEKFKEKIDAFLHKAHSIPFFGHLVDDVVSMIQLVDSYIKKEYTGIPVTSIVTVIGALIYVLSPIDLIPDAIPILGYVDDAAIILLVLKLGVGHDLEKYKGWQEKCRQAALMCMEQSTGKLLTDILGEDLLGAIILSDETKFKVFSIDSDNIENEDQPYPVKVHYLSLPVQLLRSMYLESENGFLDFLNGVIKHTDFMWSPLGILPAIHEADYNQYEDFFAIPERADGNE